MVEGVVGVFDPVVQEDQDCGMESILGHRLRLLVRREGFTVVYVTETPIHLGHHLKGDLSDCTSMIVDV